MDRNACVAGSRVQLDKLSWPEMAADPDDPPVKFKKIMGKLEMKLKESTGK
jgi:hypothetical protein